MKKCGFVLPASQARRPLGKAVLRVAHFDGAPVAGSYQADEAQQVGEGPGYIGGVVATCEAPGADLVTQRTGRVNNNDSGTGSKLPSHFCKGVSNILA